jgi:Putative restriction endonuclease
MSNGIYMTVEQYLALDEATDAKYEYDNGYVIMLRPPSAAYDEYSVHDMAGGSIGHSALCLRMGSLLDQALTDGPCMTFTSDARVQLTERQYYYPDVTVALW